MRDDAFARVGEDGPDYFVDRVENNVNSHIFRFINACYNGITQKSLTKHYTCRRISGIMSVPLYISSFLPGSHLVIDNTTNLPVYQGKADVTFTVSYTYVHVQLVWCTLGFPPSRIMDSVGYMYFMVIPPPPPPPMLANPDN